MNIYHGSDVVVEKPEILKSNRLLDFGIGFYATSNKEQAIRWAERVSLRNNTGKQLGVLDKEEAVKRLKVEKLFDQILFHTEKGLEFCVFDNYENYTRGKNNG